MEKQDKIKVKQELERAPTGLKLLVVGRKKGKMLTVSG